jgi:glycine cleavage system H lipoate-binding protein
MTKERKKHPTHPRTKRSFQVVENECIWMKAGVVNFRLCDNAYDCYTCPFDRGMRRAMKAESHPKSALSEPSWAGRLRQEHQGPSRPCRHYLTGRVQAPKICTMNYECYHCPFDQMLDDMELTMRPAALTYLNVAGYRLAAGYHYHLGHGWAHIEHGGRVRVGLDDFLTAVFGAPRALDLPALGAELKQGKGGWTFRRNGHQAQVLAPVTGRVLAINQKAGLHPEITSEDPYGEGWLMIIEPKLLKANLRGLYFGDESRRWLEKETEALAEMLGPEYARLAATGGEPVRDLFGQLPDLEWGRLVETFLHTVG